MIAFNFRPDRMRQITRKLAEEGPVDRYTTMAEYDEDWTYPGALPAEAPGADDRRGSSPGSGGRSCTSPRPRSTRT